MKRIFSSRSLRPGIVTALLLSGAAVAGAQHYDFQQITLDNGLRVVTLEDFSTPIVAVHVWYHVGSKNEDPNRQGFAHMFEHMMFKGTGRVGPEQHMRELRRVGGYSNAFTSFDYTAYVNELPANQLDRALWLEAERMMFLNVDEQNFTTERNVVAEERRQDLNEPYGTVAEKVLPVVFKELPYKWTPIGRIPHLEAAELEELQAFWNTYYVPNNAVLVIVGAVKHEDAQERARKYFGWMPRCPDPPAVAAEEPPQTEPREATFEEAQGPVPLAGYIFRGVPENHPDFVALDILMGVLGYGESSRLYLDLVKDQQIATQVMANTYGFEKAGVFGAGAALTPASDIDTVLAQLEEHLNRVIKTPVSQRELDKVKNQYRRMLITGMMTVSGKARNLGEAAVVHGDPGWLNERIDRIDAVTVEDLQRVAKEYIVPERRSTIRVLPNPDAEPSPEDAQAPEDIAQTRPLPPSDCKADAVLPSDWPRTPPENELLDELPEVEKVERTLENGLKVVVVPNREVPFATAMLGLKYGVWAEDPAHPGAANMALATLTKGTENYTAAELAEELEFNALTLDGSAGMDVSSVSATGLADKMELALKLMAEVVLRPTFPESEFEILRQQLLSSLSIREQDPNYLADRQLRKALYGEHPYARTVAGETRDVEALPLEAVKAYWARYARPDSAILYVAGDVEPERVFDWAEQYLGEWKAEGEAPKPELPTLPDNEATRIYLVDMPGAVQSQIRVAQKSITRGHPYYHPAMVYTQVFGGSMNSRLMDTIRVKRGLTYGAGGGFRPSLFTGTFTGHTFTKTPTTAETVEALLDVIRSMKQQPATEEELAEAKAYLIGGFPAQLETPQDVTSYEWIIDYFGLPEDYLNQALQGYRQTTTEDILHVAQEIVDDEKLTIVVVGDASQIREGLEKIAPVTVVTEDEVLETDTAEGTDAAA